MIFNRSFIDFLLRLDIFCLIDGNLNLSIFENFKLLYFMILILLGIFFFSFFSFLIIL